MTLIAAFEYQNAPILVGDLLLSSSRQSNQEAPTPLVHTPNAIIGSDAAGSISGLCQKVVILHEHICMAWSGRLFHAQKFSEYVRSFSSGKQAIGYAELRAFVEAYAREDIDGHFDFVMYSWHGTGWGYFTNLKPFDLGLPELSQVRVGGSGTPQFIRHIEKVASAPMIGDIDSYTSLALRALCFAGLSSAEQVFGGIGLSEWWGGGFEVAVFDGKRLAKLGPICWLYWECSESPPGNFSLVLKPSFMYQYYVGDMAVFWIDEDSQGTNKHHFVSPPFAIADPPVDRPDRFETYTVVNLMRMSALGSDIGYGGSVDTRSASGDPDLKITWESSGPKTTVAIREAFLTRMLRGMPLPAEAIIDVDLWGQKIQVKKVPEILPEQNEPPH